MTLSDPLEVIPTVGSLPVYNTWIHTAHIAYVYNYTRLKKISEFISIW